MLEVTGDVPVASVPVEVVNNSIAVLPFANISSDPENEFFCDGISEELLNKLSAFDELRVIARTSSFAFKGADVGIPQIAAALGVRYLLQGSVRKFQNEVRIAAQLVDSDGQQVWSTSFDRELRGIFDIQREIADAVATNVVPRISTGRAEKTPPDIRAYEQYLIGHEYIATRVGSFDVLAVEALEKAIDLDPTFAAPYAELAIALRLLRNPSGDAEGIRRRAQTLIDRAKALDPGLARAYAAQGLLMDLTAPDDLAGAEAELRRALELDPNATDTYLWLGNNLAMRGRHEEGDALYQAALRIDPLHPVINGNIAVHLSRLGRFAEAEAALLRMLEMPRPSQMAFRAMAGFYRDVGRQADAMAILLRQIEQQPRSEPLIRTLALIEICLELGMTDAAQYWHERILALPDGFVDPRLAVGFYAEMQGRYAEAVDHIYAAVERYPDGFRSLSEGARVAYGIAAIRADRYEQGIDILKSTSAYQSITEARITSRTSMFMALVRAHAAVGGADEAAALLEKLEDAFAAADARGEIAVGGKQYQYGLIAMLGNRHEFALDRLRAAIDAGWNDYRRLMRSQIWAPLRDDPRFRAEAERARASIEEQRRLVDAAGTETAIRAAYEAVNTQSH